MRYILFFLVFFDISLAASQNNYKNGNQPFQSPREGKSLVYITRSGGAFLVNFRIYKDSKFIGALTSGDYFVVECEPGKHLFWAASENRDYVETNVEINKVYVINVEAQMGAFVSGVSIVPQDPNNKKHKKRFHKTIKNENAVVYDEKLVLDDKSDNIEKGLKKYEELKKSNSTKIEILSTNMNFVDSNKPE